VARVALSPTYYVEYNIGTGCYPGHSLSAIAREPDVKRALDNESVSVFMLSAYYGVTSGDGADPHWLNPSFYTPQNTAALVHEYSDFTLNLYQTYQHTNKRFIVSDWEGDNAVYCGQASTTPPIRKRDLSATPVTLLSMGTALPLNRFKV
jgi:hypothetical protein